MVAKRVALTPRVLIRAGSLVGGVRRSRWLFIPLLSFVIPPFWNSDEPDTTEKTKIHCNAFKRHHPQHCECELCKNQIERMHAHQGHQISSMLLNHQHYPIVPLLKHNKRNHGCDFEHLQYIILQHSSMYVVIQFKILF